MITELEAYLSLIEPLEKEAVNLAWFQWDHIAKPLRSLGILEEDIVKIAGIRGNADVKLEKKALLILCSDNGIVEENVTQTGQEVTAVVTRNMTEGTSSVCLMAGQAGIDIFPVDMGVASDVKSGTLHPLINRKIAYGTKNFQKEPAMTREEALLALETGINLVKDLSLKGYGLIATGEMGIGNTTTSSAVASMLLGKEPKELTGRGAGLDDHGLSRKLLVIQEAIKRYSQVCRDAVDVLACVGGFDLAGLAGVFLGGAIYRIPILIDGFISAAAALAADVIFPGCRDFMLASHVSAEPAGQLLLETLGLKPLIRAGMCLGEGTGAVAAVPLLDMALTVYREMSSFQEIHIDEYKHMGDKK